MKKLVPPPTAAPTPALTSRWSPARRRFVSLLLLYHLAAILIAPLAVPPTSGLFLSGWRVVRPYIELLYLNHGYHYFAPEPEASTLISFTVTRADGGTVNGTSPHKGIAPRLLYHRHFMLTEFLNFAPDDWHLWYARHLLKKYDGETVVMSRITHLVPTMERVRQGASLTAPESYLEQPLGTFTWDSH
ncbi:MAG: hypothetical protein ACRC1K_13285 [Planctomycetia bacterium]